MVGASPEASSLKLWASGVPLVSVLVESLQTRCKKKQILLQTQSRRPEGAEISEPTCMMIFKLSCFLGQSSEI